MSENLKIFYESTDENDGYNSVSNNTIDSVYDNLKEILACDSEQEKEHEVWKLFKFELKIDE